MLHSTPTFQFAILTADQAPFQGSVVLWRLKRRSLVTSVQLGWFYLLLCVACVGMTAFLSLQGELTIMTLALLGIGTAFFVYSRHEGDTEKIVLQDGQLVVELESAGRMQRAAFSQGCVRIEPRNEDGSLIEVSGQGRLVRVGRHVRPELRPQLAREIRLALRTC